MVADVAVSAVDVEVQEEDEVALAVVAAALPVVEVGSVVDVVLQADEVLPVAEAEVVLVDEVVALPVVAAAVVVDEVVESPVPEVDPTSLSSLTDTRVSSSPKARRCSWSPRTLPLASRSTARSAFPSRPPVLALMAPPPRPNTVSGIPSDRSLLPVFSAVSTTSILHQARRCSTSVLPAVPRFRMLPTW